MDRGAKSFAARGPSFLREEQAIAFNESVDEIEAAQKRGAEAQKRGAEAAKRGAAAKASLGYQHSNLKTPQNAASILSA